MVEHQLVHNSTLQERKSRTFCECAPVFCNGDCPLFIVYHDHIIPEYNLHCFINKESLEE